MKYIFPVFAAAILSFFLVNQELTAQNSHFHSVEEISLDPDVYLSLSIKEQNKSNPTGFTVSLPTAHDCYEDFEATIAPLMSKKYMDKFPLMRTYYIRKKDDPGTLGRMMVSDHGISYVLSSTDVGTITLQPKDWEDKSLYRLETGFADDANPGEHFCSTDDTDAFQIPDNIVKGPQGQNGDFKRIFRLGIVTTAQYYQGNGNASGPVNAAIVTVMNSVQFMYEKDAGISFDMLIPVTYSTPLADPFIPENAGGASRPVQAAEVVAMNYPVNNFDIGQVLHESMTGDGFNGGGVAYLGAVCRNTPIGTGYIKGGGWSGWDETNTTRFYQVVAHEMGHMFNATHTFNASGGSCSTNISNTSAYEIGSGNTVMSYRGLCAENQNIEAQGIADNYFHIHSIDQMIDYVRFQPDCEGIATSDLGNNMPEADANPCGATYLLPVGTPWFLTGEGTDVDAEDDLTFQWEPYDEDGSGTPAQGFIGEAAGNNPRAPLFRSLPANRNQTRYFPRYTDYVEGIENPFEALPNVNRKLNFRFVVRDNNVEDGAGIAWDQITLDVKPSGPLEVTGPADGTTITAGNSVNITWNTNGTDQVCNVADLLLSLDGGYSFPIVLADDVDYASGSHTLTLPEGLPNSEGAKLMVRCDDYECFKFFNFTPGSFTVESSCFATASSICNDGPETFNTSAPGLNLDLGGAVGARVTSLARQVSASSPQMLAGVQSSNGFGCNGVKMAEYELVELSVTEGGNYKFNVDVENQGGEGYVSLYRKADFDINSPCLSYEGSSARASGQGTVISYRESFTANLDACTQYVLAFYNDGEYPVETSITSFEGPGNVLESNAEGSENFSYTYIALDLFTGIIDLVSPDANFISLLPGDYEIYGAYYKTGGPTPPPNIDPNSWIGKSIEEIYIEGQCGVFSSNAKPVTILSTCSISPNIMVGAQSGCDMNTNLYTQQLTISYSLNPTVGFLNVNGQEFDITGSPQTVTLTGLLSDGESVDANIFFSEDPNCIQYVSDVFTAQDNCCPFFIELQDTYNGCAGETITMDAGSQAETYDWFRNGDLVESGTNSVLQVSEGGTYTVEVRNSTGCLRIATAEVAFFANPELDLGEDREVCGAGTTRVNAITDATLFEWYVNDILQETDQFFQPVFEQGEYKCEVINAFGCTAADSVILTVLPTPEIDFPPSTFLCEGESSILDAGPDGVDYKWTYKGDTLTHTAQTLETFMDPGIYTVTVTGSNGCSNTGQTVVVINSPPTLEMSQDTAICETGGFAIISAVASASDLQWFLNNEPILNANDFAVTAFEPGTYTLESISNLGCVTRDSIIVSGLPSPVVDIPMEQSLCGNELLLEVPSMPGETYTWKQGVDVVQDGPNNTYLATEEGVYEIIVTSSGGCTANDVTIISFGEVVEIDLGPDITDCDSELFLNANSNTFNIEWTFNGVPDPTQSGDTYYTNQTGMILATGLNTDGCTASDSMFYTNFREPDYTYPEDTILCIGTDFAFELDNPDGFTLKWYRDNTLVATDENPYAVSTSGTYRIDYESGLPGCDFSFETFVEFVTGPELVVNQEVFEGCEGDDFMLIANTNGEIVEWQFEGVTIDGETGINLEADQNGTYTVVAGGIGDCDISKDFEVILSPTPNFDLGEDVSSCGDTTIVLETDNDSFNYEWFLNGTIIAGEDGNTLTVSESGTYSVYAFINEECPFEDEIVLEIGSPPSVSITGILGICDGESTTLTAETTSENIQWYMDGVEIDGATEPELIVDVQGDYSVVTNPGSSCSSDDEVTVSSGMGAMIDLGPDRELCDGETFLLETGSASADIQWFLNGQPIDGAIGPDYEVTEGGVYQVQIMGTGGCDSQDEIEFTYFPNPILVMAETFAFCTGGSIMVEAQTDATDIEWYNGSILIDGATEKIIEVNEPGEYTVVVTIGPCTESATTEVIENTALSIDLGPDESICRGDGFTLDAGGGAASYEWFLNGSTLPFSDQSIEPTTTGTYTVIVTVAADCSAEDEVFIEVSDSPMVSLLEEEASVCLGDTYEITAFSDGDNIRWYYEGSFVPGEDQLNYEVSEAGTYTFESFNENEDCAQSVEFVLETFDAPDVELGDDVSQCAGDPIILDAGEDGIEYLWFQDGLPIAEDVATLEVTETGIYTVEVSAGQNCTTTDVIDIEIIDLPDVSLPSSISFCTGQQFLLEVDGFALNYEWAQDDTTLPGEDDDQLIIEDSGIYTLTAYNFEECPVILEVEATESDSPEVDLGGNQSICSGETLVLDAGGSGAEYTWFLDGTILTGEELSTIEIAVPGMYSVDVSAGADCEGSDQIEVTVANIPMIGLSGPDNICEGQTETIEANIDIDADIRWYLDGVLIDGEEGNTLEITVDGEYTCEAFESEDCPAEESITVAALSAPEVDLGEDVFECSGADLTLNAGNDGAEYQWFLDGEPIDGETNQTYEVLESGIYSVSVIAGLDCDGTDEIVVDFSGVPDISLPDEASFCEGGSTMIEVMGDATNYQWFLDGTMLDGETNANIEVFEIGTYTVEAYNNEECPAELEIEITQIETPPLDLGGDQNLCLGSDAVLSTDADGVSFEWYQDGVLIESDVTEINVTQSGDYSLVITTAEDCTVEDEVTVTISDAPSVSLSDGLVICSGLSIDLMADSDATNYIWYLDDMVINDGTDQVITIDAPGNYTVEAYDNIECISMAETEVTAGAMPDVNIGEDIILCPGESIELEAGTFSSYEWIDGTTQSNFVIVNDGTSSIENTETYSVTVTNDDNCTASDELDVTFLPVISASVTADDMVICEGESVTLSASGGGSYSWNNPSNSLDSDTGSTVVATPLNTSTYVVTVTDDQCDGNEDSASINISVSVANINASQDTCVFAGQDIVIGVTGGVNYTWASDPSIQSPTTEAGITVAPEETTLYQVIITDAAGCEYERFIEVCVKEDPTENLDFVTIMTPNGDGANDVLEFVGLEQYNINRLRVFNRWGVQIYERLNYQTDEFRFDGTRNGVELPPDTYYYILEFEGFVIKKTLTIIKE